MDKRKENVMNEIEELLKIIEQREEAIEEIRKENFGRELITRYKIKEEGNDN